MHHHRGAGQLTGPAPLDQGRDVLGQRLDLRPRQHPASGAISSHGPYHPAPVPDAPPSRADGPADGPAYVHLMFGVFVSGGMDFRIGNIRIDLNTEEIQPVTVSVRLDTGNHWLYVARDMRDKAESALTQVVAASEAKDDGALGTALEEEFRCGMLGISAAAFAIDAFYASIKERYQPHPHEAEWRASGLARYKQIAETLRWAWTIRPPAAKAIRDHLRQVFELRDLAVHPPAKFREPILREDIERGVEWRFVYFRAENTRAAFRIASEIIEALIRESDKAASELKEWLDNSRPWFASAAGYEVRNLDDL